MIPFVENPFFAKNYFMFSLFWFMPFLAMCREIEKLFRLLKGGAWEIVIIDSKLIWNTPKAIKGSFVLNLSDIEEVVSLRIKDSESQDTYHYHIKLKSGEKIDLDENSGASLDKLAPLLGVFRQINS